MNEWWLYEYDYEEKFIEQTHKHQAIVMYGMKVTKVIKELKFSNFLFLSWIKIKFLFLKTCTMQEKIKTIFYQFCKNLK